MCRLIYESGLRMLTMPDALQILGCIPRDPSPEITAQEPRWEAEIAPTNNDPGTTFRDVQNELEQLKVGAHLLSD